MANVDEINCIDCTSSEHAVAELESKLARLDMQSIEKPSLDTAKVQSGKEQEFSALTQKWIDWIVQLDLSKLSESDTLPLPNIPLTFESKEEYQSVFLEHLRAEARERLHQSLKACSGRDGLKDRYPGDKITAHIVRFQPRAAKEAFKSDIIVVRAASRSNLRVHDCVVLNWNDIQSPAQLGVVTFLSEEASEAQIKLAVPSKTAYAVDTKLMRRESVPLSIQAIDNIITQSRIAVALQWPTKPAIFDDILHVRPTYASEVQTASLGELKFWAESQMNYNPSQIRALEAVANDQNRLLLIQGPPGTGKTATILGACAALLYQGKRVLVTSPSNHAVDSIAKICVQNGLGPVAYKPPMSLVGAADSVALASSVENIFVDTRLKKCIAILENLLSAVSNSLADDIPKLRAFISELQAQTALPSGIQRRLISCASSIYVNASSVMANVERNVDSFRQLCKATLQTLRSSSSFDAWSRKLVRDSKLCFSTISSAGRSIMRESGRFDCVIVDEATQATEAETNILLVLDTERLVLVGDPNQLTGTVVSTKAKMGGFAKSLLERAVLCGQEAMLLNTQYRMHPHIVRFSNEHFYGGALKTADTVLDGDAYHDCLLWPITFFDISGVETGGKGERSESLSNQAEAQVVGEVIHVLVDGCNLTPGSIGIITPYAAQVKLIQTTVEGLFGREIASSIEVNTVDGFQGREKDIVIISFVRSNSRGQLGFVQDSKRLNVSITRAKYALILVGSHPTLHRSEPGSPMTEFAKHTTDHVIDLTSAMLVKDLTPLIAKGLLKECEPPKSGDRPGEPVAHRTAPNSQRISRDNVDVAQSRGRGRGRGQQRGVNRGGRGRGTGSTPRGK